MLVSVLDLVRKQQHDHLIQDDAQARLPKRCPADGDSAGIGGCAHSGVGPMRVCMSERVHCLWEIESWLKGTPTHETIKLYIYIVRVCCEWLITQASSGGVSAGLKKCPAVSRDGGRASVHSAT